LAVGERLHDRRAVGRALRGGGRRARSEDGLALVEFALLLPVLALLLFGMLDFGKAFNYWIDETHLANEGARFAAVNRNPGGSGMTLQQFIREQATTAELKNGGTSSVGSPLQVCVAFPSGTSNVGDPVKVTVQTTYTWLGFIAGRIGLNQTTIRGQATMRLEAAPTNYQVANNIGSCT
jgi:Flp pilus assembly protein TadG